MCVSYCKVGELCQPGRVLSPVTLHRVWEVNSPIGNFLSTEIDIGGVLIGVVWSWNLLRSSLTRLDTILHLLYRDGLFSGGMLQIVSYIPTPSQRQQPYSSRAMLIRSVQLDPFHLLLNIELPNSQYPDVPLHRLPPLLVYRFPL